MAGEEAEMAGTTGAPSRGRRVRLVVILGALSAFGPLSIDMYLPAFPAIAHDLHAGASEVQLTLTACLVGLALGQCVAGPVSDALGRRRPLLAGLAGYAVLSLACALAPSVGVLAVLRFLQALGGAAGLVIANASVRDRRSGPAMARFLSALLLVNGLAPVLAPLIGAQILRVGSWRWVFGLLAILGVLLLVACALWLDESLPPQRRSQGSLRNTLGAYRRLGADRLFVGYALVCGLSFAAMFCYISGSSFVLQNIFGLSPQGFSLVFAVNSVGIITAGQCNGRLVGRVGPRRLLGAGLVLSTFGGVLLLVAVLTGLGLPVILPALFAVVAAVGLISPNTVTLAMAEYPEFAGTAAALIGVLQFLIGGLVAPLTGLGGGTTAVPMGLLIGVLPACSALVFLTVARGHRAGAATVGG